MTKKEALAARLYAALRRISREKWISSDGIYEIALRLALCKEKNMEAAMSAVRCAFQSDIETQDCTHVGMIHGLPPFRSNTNGFREFQGFVNGKKQSGMKPLEAELRILKLQLKGM